MRDKIFVSLSTFAEYGSEPLDILKESGIDFFLNPTGKRVVREEIIEMGRDATGIVAGVEPYDKFVLDRLPNLKCISRVGVGIDAIDLEYAKEKNVIIKNTPNVVIKPVVELTVAMIFDLMRKLSLHTARLKDKQWKKTAGNLLAGKKVGILGTGRIGKAVAEMLNKLDADVIAFDVYPDNKWAVENNVRYVEMDSLLSTSDVLTLHISIDEKNLFFLDRNKIELMKDGASLINVSRGKLVDEEAVYNALKTEKLSGAAFDVFPEEPYTGKLCELENVVLTPHVATLTRESRMQMETEAIINLLQVLHQN